MRWVVALSLSGIALWILGRSVDGAAFVDSLGDVRIGYLLASLGASGLYHLTRMVRWGGLVRPIAIISRRQVVSICAIGYMAINIIPFRVGELVRPALLTEREGVAFSKGMAVTIVERLMDLLAVMALFLIAIAWTPLAVETVEIGSYQVDLADEGRQALAGAIGLFAAAAVLPLLLGERGERWAQRLLGRRLGGLYSDFRAGLRLIGSPRALGGGVAWTVVSWTFNATALWLMALAFGMDSLGLWGATLVLALLVVGIMLPGPPGFAGVFEAFCVAGLSLQGIEASAAAAYAVALHMTQLLVIIGTGIVFLWLDGLSWNHLTSLARPAGERPAQP